MNDLGDIYDEEGFLAAFLEEMNHAKGLILIKSTYVAATRIAKMVPIFRRCRRRNVHICAYIQDPTVTRFDNDESRQRIAVANAAIHMLTTAGLEVYSVPKVHEKAAVIDDQIAWTGTMNILSYNDTGEEMTRFVGRHNVQDVIRRHELIEIASRDGVPPAWALTYASNGGPARNTFGRLLSIRRQEFELSQAKLAELSGVSQCTISKIESGLVDSRLSTIEALSRVLDCNIAPTPAHLLPSIAPSIVDRPSPKGKRTIS